MNTYPALNKSARRTYEPELSCMPTEALLFVY